MTVPLTEVGSPSALSSAETSTASSATPSLFLVNLIESPWVVASNRASKSTGVPTSVNCFESFNCFWSPVPGLVEAAAEVAVVESLEPSVVVVAAVVDSVLEVGLPVDSPQLHLHRKQRDQCHAQKGVSDEVSLHESSLLSAKQSGWVSNPQADHRGTARRHDKMGGHSSIVSSGFAPGLVLLQAACLVGAVVAGPLASADQASAHASRYRSRHCSRTDQQAVRTGHGEY